MSGQVLNYYAGGNTARGFHDLFATNLEHLERVFILKGGPGTGKSSLMKTIGETWLEKGFDIEYLHCASDNGSIDGVIIPTLTVGIVDGTAPHVIEPKAPGAIEEYVNLGVAWDSEALAKEKDQILSIQKNNRAAYDAAYACFQEALTIHDEWEAYYIDHLDREQANQLTDELINRLYGDQVLNKTADVRHRFLGAATPQGAVDFIPNLTSDVAKRYFIKGRPGSGKSTMLKTLAKMAEDRGFDVEVYHCGFDPYSLDMIIVRELDFAIFDSTAPHEHYPERDSDEVIDMYERVIEPGVDEKYAVGLKDVSERYSERMKEATAHLANAKAWHDQLETIYVNAMDFTKIDDITEQIKSEIVCREDRSVAK
ncbi:PRK06851 family protein [Tuberibacillus sp. Marseille-P3662]|uniref:PRK06851 family protein n=1 Tax=Tuberibacillus sp. Marseille-P3662 TaxID=1965358 RepID=UPI000A1CAAB5|nr:PRK06851 family protein [Tuberibacillus sp. Marseille-P3662]